MFSCSSDDDIVLQTQAMGLKKITYSTNNYILFDTQERIDIINSLHRTTQFNYDAQSRVSSISVTENGATLVHNVIYDANDKIRSIGSRTFTYDSLLNQYGEDSTYGFFQEITSTYTETETWQRLYRGNIDNNLLDQCDYSLITIVDANGVTTGRAEECFSVGSFSFYFNVDNNISVGEEFPEVIDYSSTINPANQSGKSNLDHLFGFLRYRPFRDSINIPSSYLLFSAHIPDAIQNDPGGPQMRRRIFTYDNQGRIESYFTEYYYLDTLENTSAPVLYEYF